MRSYTSSGGSTLVIPTNWELRQDGSVELREDLTVELREDNT